MMRTLGVLVAVYLLLLADLIQADVYMHNMRGSNNRLNERTATRANNNRMFDSQNNARGGYNFGDKNAQAAQNENDQYRMTYFQSGLVGDSELGLEWTNQHGCGNDDSSTNPLKLNCNLVLQFRCQDDNTQAAPQDSTTMRNGQNTQTSKYTRPPNQDEGRGPLVGRRAGDRDAQRGLHEPWSWYDQCYRRRRNSNLFVADQEPKKNGLGIEAATATRQNPNNGRSGYECAEERDYYPYWHPTPWTDAAVLAHNSTMCSYYRENSFNRKPYGMCVEKFGANKYNYHSQHNNPTSCATAEGEWVQLHSHLQLVPSAQNKASCEALNSAAKRKRGMVYKWGKPYDETKIEQQNPIVDACFLQPPPVDCKTAKWSRVNHLGDGLDASPHSYTWKLPRFHNLNQPKRCVFRLRYNISTDDYAPWDTDAAQNQVKSKNVVLKRSPIENNPLVDIGANNQPLRLAINTAQFGRTFQDRSHVFKIAKRPEGVSDEARVLNLNVRGKRGNIVQTYPAVEYDFVPTRMQIKQDDHVHVQWTGSNTHNNKAPGGDGQTGDAGEGAGGTDRNNFLELLNPAENFPRPYESASIYDNMQVKWNSAGANADQKDVAIQLASSGYYKCARASKCGGGQSIDGKQQLNPTLDQASPSYAGLVATFSKGTYHYVCTRNNNFTNRSQKGCIVVE